MRKIAVLFVVFVVFASLSASQAEARGRRNCCCCVPAAVAAPVQAGTESTAAPQVAQSPEPARQTRSYSYSPSTTQTYAPRRYYYSAPRTPGYLLPKSSPLKFSVH